MADENSIAPAFGGGEVISITGTGGAPFILPTPLSSTSPLTGYPARRLVIRADDKVLFDYSITFADLLFICRSLCEYAAMDAEYMKALVGFHISATPEAREGMLNYLAESAEAIARANEALSQVGSHLSQGDDQTTTSPT